MGLSMLELDSEYIEISGINNSNATQRRKLEGRKISYIGNLEGGVSRKNGGKGDEGYTKFEGLNINTHLCLVFLWIL